MKLSLNHVPFCDQCIKSKQLNELKSDVLFAKSLNSSSGRWFHQPIRMDAKWIGSNAKFTETSKSRHKQQLSWSIAVVPNHFLNLGHATNRIDAGRTSGQAGQQRWCQVQTADTISCYFPWTLTKPSQGNGATKNDQTKRAAAFLRMSRTHCRSQALPRRESAKSKGQPHRNHKCSSSDEGRPNQSVTTRLYQTILYSLPAAFASREALWWVQYISEQSSGKQPHSCHTITHATCVFITIKYVYEEWNKPINTRQAVIQIYSISYLWSHIMSWTWAMSPKIIIVSGSCMGTNGTGEEDRRRLSPENYNCAFQADMQDSAYKGNAKQPMHNIKPQASVVAIGFPIMRQAREKMRETVAPSIYTIKPVEVFLMTIGICFMFVTGSRN